MSLRAISILSTLGILSGCTVGYNDKEPALPSVSWLGEQNEEDGVDAWWETFQDATLTTLVEKVANENLTLRGARQRVVEARALRRSAQSTLLPNLNANASVTRIQQSLNDPQFSPSPGQDIPRRQDIYDVGFDAAWELDLFGGNRLATKSAEAAVEAAVAGTRDVLLTLIAETARNYLELRGNQRRLELLKRNVELQRRTVELAQASYKVGLMREVAVLREQADLANIQSMIPGVEAEVRSAAYRLAVLTGTEPGALYQNLEQTSSTFVSNKAIPVGLKSDLLRRRPDIQIAERELAAASAELGIAISDLYPSFNLTGGFGFVTGEESELFEASSETFRLTPFVHLPIFQGGRLRAIVEAAEGRNERAALAYQQTILNALEETESALIRYSKSQQTLSSLQEAVDASSKSLARSRTLHEKGLIGLSEVLQAERALNQAEDALVRSETSSHVNRVALYKSLGGGWEVFEESENPAQETSTLAKSD